MPPFLTKSAFILPKGCYYFSGLGHMHDILKSKVNSMPFLKHIRDNVVMEGILEITL